jgi:hypothetical protein
VLAIPWPAMDAPPAATVKEQRPQGGREQAGSREGKSTQHVGAPRNDVLRSRIFSYR